MGKEGSGPQMEDSVKQHNSHLQPDEAEDSIIVPVKYNINPNGSVTLNISSKTENNNVGENALSKDPHSEGGRKVAVVIADTKRKVTAETLESRALDGGWGWFVVLGCMIMHLLLGGLNRSYGVIYMELQRRFRSSAAITAWVGGVGAAIRMGCSPLATALSTRYSVRSVVMVGGLIMGFGMILSAFTPNTEFMFFSYGILVGVGGSLVYAPPIVLVGQYFHRLRGIASALGSCGSGIGMFAFPPLIALLFETYSYMGACLIIGAIMFNCCVSGALMRPLESNNPMPKKFDSEKLKKELFDMSLWRNPLFLSFAFSLGFITMSYYAAQILLSDFATEIGWTYKEAVRLLSYLGIADTVGRVVGGFLFDAPFIRPRRVHYYNFVILISGCACFAWAGSNSYGMLVTVTVIHGLFNGCVVSQRPVIAADLMGADRLSGTFGLTVFVQGCGLMIGPVIAGLIKDKLGSYRVSYIFCGAMGILASVIFLCGSLCKSCRRERQMHQVVITNPAS